MRLVGFFVDEKAAEVLLRPPGELVKGDAELEYIEGVEAVKAFTERWRKIDL